MLCIFTLDEVSTPTVASAGMRYSRVTVLKHLRNSHNLHLTNTLIAIPNRKERGAMRPVP